MNKIHQANSEVYQTGWRYWIMLVTSLVLMIFRKRFILLNKTQPTLQDSFKDSTEPNLIITIILIVAGLVFSFFVTKILGIDAYDFKNVPLFIQPATQPLITSVRYQYNIKTMFEIPNIDLNTLPYQFQVIVINDTPYTVEINKPSLSTAKTSPTNANANANTIMMPITGTIITTTYLTDTQVLDTIKSLKLVFKSTDAITITETEGTISLQVNENEKLTAVHQANAPVNITSRSTMLLTTGTSLDNIDYAVIKNNGKVLLFRKDYKYNIPNDLLKSFDVDDVDNVDNLDNKTASIYVNDSQTVFPHDQLHQSVNITTDTIDYYVSTSEPLLIRFITEFFGNERLLYLLGLVSITLVFFLIKYRTVILQFVPNNAAKAVSFGFFVNPNHPYVAEVLLTGALVVMGFFSMLISLLLIIATMYMLFRDKDGQVQAIGNITDPTDLNEVLKLVDLDQL